MSELASQKITTQKETSPTLVAAIVGIVAFLAPAVYEFYSLATSDGLLIAMLWVYSFTFIDNPQLLFHPALLLSWLPFTFLRLAFVVMMHRLYSGKTTMKRCAVVGIISELQFPVMASFPYLIMLTYNPILISHIPIFIPIPILTFAGLLITRLFKPPDTGMWIEKEQSQSWWDKSKVEGDTSPELMEVVDDAVESVKKDG